MVPLGRGDSGARITPVARVLDSDASKPARRTLKDSAEIRAHSASVKPVPITPKITRVAGARPSAKHVPPLLPKQKQFPSPAPLTDEERALLAFVARSPKQAEEVLADAKNRSAEPIEIKEIQIEPLQDGGHE